MRKRLCLGLLMFISLAGQSQDFSNKGKDFWLAYGYHVKMPGANSQQMVLYFTSDVTASVTIEIPSVGYSQTLTVPANTAQTSAAIPKTGTQDARLTQEGLFNTGIHITSDKPVVAYAHIYDQNVSGATLLFPTNTLGSDYYSLNFTQTSNESNSNSWACVVATENNTVVEITPSGATTGGRPAGTPFTVTLGQGQVYNIMGTLSGNTGVDLTGTRIRSVSSGSGACKRIAVFSGSGKINIGCTNGSADNLFQQAFPKNAWGKKYLTAPTSTMPNNYFRVAISTPGTVVKWNGTVLTGLTGNFYYQFLTSAPGVIEADQPIMVAQYISSQGCIANGTPGDPEMIYLSPVEQTISSVVLNSTPNYAITGHYINVVMKAADVGSFKLDGANRAASFTVHPQDGNYMYAQFTGLSAGQHTLLADSGFSAIAYGFGNAESYGYNAGTNLRDLYQYISINNQYATVNYPAGCKNSPLKFAMTFPYQPTAMEWHFNGLFPDTAIATPVYDSTWVANGKTLYRYTLVKNYTITTIGTYPIVVLATNPSPDGCSGQQEIDYDLQIYDRPVAAFTYTSNGCTNGTVAFKDQTGTLSRPVIKYVWDFGDAGGAGIQNPSHPYAAAGSFIVKYNIITDVGCLSDTAMQTLNISNPPTAGFALQGPACDGQVVTIKDQSAITAGNNLVKWYWDLGDGTTVTNTSNVSIQHLYAGVQGYNVSLQVESNTGCKSTVTTIPVQVHYLPVPNFSLPRICLSDPTAIFNDSSTIADHSEAQFTYGWDFGDGGTATQKNGQHKYLSTGPKNVTLTVTSKDGCIADTIKTFTVNGTQPVAGFNLSTQPPLCSNKGITLLDQSTVDVGSITRVEIYWDYLNDPLNKTVDDSAVAGRLYVHQYAAFGTPLQQSYQVRYFTSSGPSCTSPAKVQTVTLDASPKIQFDTLLPVCAEVAPFQVTAAKDIYGLPGTGVYSGAGISGQGLFNPAAATAGTHAITYTFTAANGCSDTQTKTVIVYPTPKLDAGPDRYLLEGGDIIINAIAPGNAPAYLWTPSAYLDNPAALTPVCTASMDITYTITATSGDGCVASDDMFVKILKNIKVPNAFSPNGDGINDTWMIQYLDTYPGCTVDVYNRYGQQVFHSTGYSRPWDGRVNGQPLPVAVYYWIIDPKNGRRQVSGSITIIR